MTDSTICNICEHSGKFESATEVNQVYSNVRKFKDHSFTVWRCPFCRSLHCKEEVDLDYYYADYPVSQFISTQESPNTALFRHIFRRMKSKQLKFLKKQGLKKEHKLLDYGCADGAFLSFLQEMGYKNVFGYDPYSPQYCDTKVLEQKYDVIVSYDVIEHVNEPNDCLDKLIGSLNEGGLLVIGTPNANEINLLNPKKSFMELHQPYHRHILSEKALLNLAVSKGLEVLKVDKRYYADTLYPAINIRFLWSYISHVEMVMDIALEPFRMGLILTSPKLLFYAFFGYFFPQPGYMMISFRNL